MCNHVGVGSGRGRSPLSRPPEGTGRDAVSPLGARASGAHTCRRQGKRCEKRRLQDGLCGMGQFVEWWQDEDENGGLREGCNTQ